jgi:hypothetical protein
MKNRSFGPHLAAMNRTQLVLFGMKNGTIGPHFACMQGMFTHSFLGKAKLESGGRAQIENDGTLTFP